MEPPRRAQLPSGVPVRGGSLESIARERQAVASPRRVLRRLWAEISDFWPQYVMIGVVVVAGALAMAAGPYLIGRAIDQAIALRPRRPRSHHADVAGRIRRGVGGERAPVPAHRPHRAGGPGPLPLSDLRL